MAIHSLTSPPHVRRPTRTPQLDYELIERAVALFESGELQPAMQRVFQHLLPTLTLPEGATGHFTFPQGSSQVTVRWDEGAITISVPLVRLPAGGGTAALRFLLSRISGSGQLHQPRLRGDDVYLEFHEKLARLHPLKLVEVLRRMPVEADSNDDWMVDQFGVTLLERQPVEPLDADELARAEIIWRAHWNEVEELHKEAQRKRSIFFLNEVTAYTLYHPRAALPLMGSLSARLAEAADTFNDTDNDPSKREPSLAKCVKAMKAVTADELGKSLGHAQYTISPLSDGTPQVLTSYLGAGEYVETVERARTSGKVMEAAVALFSTYNYLLVRFSWPEAIEAGLKQALEQASGKPWREAANVLATQGKALVESWEDEDEDDEDDEDGDPENEESADEEGDDGDAAEGEA